MDNHITLVLGHRGSGKSTWLFRNIESFRPFILIDPLFDPKYQQLGLYEIEDLEELGGFFRTGRPERVYISPNRTAFDLVCGLCLARGGITMVIDEVDNYATTHRIGDYFRQVLKYGRHRGVNLVMVARRAKEINPLLRSQATRFIIFPLGAEDAAELRTHIGDEAARTLGECRREDARTEYIDFGFSTNKFEKRILEFVKV